MITYISIRNPACKAKFEIKPAARKLAAGVYIQRDKLLALKTVSKTCISMLTAVVSIPEAYRLTASPASTE